MSKKKGTLKRNKKAKSISKLKKKLDSLFSKYIRAKYPAKCFTCGLVKRRKNLQCGHFVSRKYLATRWEEKNCRPQCAGCNLFGDGMLLDFEENLIKEIGLQEVLTLKEKRKELWKLKPEWYEDQIKSFAAKLEEYEN